MAVPVRAATTERHRIRQQTIRAVTAERLGVLLRSLPDLSDEQLVRYVEAAYPTVAGGQRIAADSGAAYAATLAPPGRSLQRMDVDGALERSGVLIAPDSRSLVAPVLRARKLTGEGAEHRIALSAAAAYAGSLSSNDLQAAMRVGVDEGARAVDLRVTGWRKSLSPDACEWCQEVATDTYRDPDGVPFHDNDHCSVEPALD